MKHTAEYKWILDMKRHEEEYVKTPEEEHIRKFRTAMPKTKLLHPTVLAQHNNIVVMSLMAALILLTYWRVLMVWKSWCRFRQIMQECRFLLILKKL